MNDKPDPMMPATRRDRLSAALRENLKRRKAQARGRAGAATPVSYHDADAAPPPAPRGDDEA